MSTKLPTIFNSQIRALDELLLLISDSYPVRRAESCNADNVKWKSRKTVQGLRLKSLVNEG